MRVVLDTNVFISALLFNGRLSQLVSLWHRGRIKLLVSGEITREYLQVLAYPKFSLTKTEIMKLIQDELVSYVENVEILHRTKIVTDDPSDNKFLECAVSGKADYIISGDDHLLDLKRYEGIPIIRASELLEMFA